MEPVSAGAEKTKLTIAYDGTGFQGWQVQKDRPTVQKALQDALEALCGRRLPVTGCSRTDAGVHANEFVCHTERIGIPCERLPRALGAHLPDSIAVKKAELVPESFHARYSCTGKEYLYLIDNGTYRNPFLRGHAMYYPHRIDTDALQEAAFACCGTQDFRAFMASGSKITDTVRSVTDCTLFRRGALVVLRIAADGFLYNMVRIIVGTLLDAAEKRQGAAEMRKIIASKKRENAGRTVPACGLYLNRVFYGPHGAENEPLLF